jgi:predicted lipoprotein with Yx(FWY)xxD motif
MRRTLVIISLVAVFGLVAGACGDDDNGDDAASTSTTAGSTGTTDTSGDTTTTASGSEAVVIGTGQTDYGEVLTDGDGLTLYVFDDDGDSGVATCVDSCADIWPPVIAENIETRGELDIEANLVEGDGAERQVTINGRPVYTYSGDVEPGDATGQGFGGKWWVLDPDGNPIESTVAAVTSTSIAE